MFGLVGPDGAGKTTIIRMLCGILAPGAGGGRILGKDLLREPDLIKRENRVPLTAVLALRRPDGGREHRILRGDQRGP